MVAHRWKYTNDPELGHCQDCNVPVMFDAECVALPLCETCRHIRDMSLETPRVLDPWRNQLLEVILARDYEVTPVLTGPWLPPYQGPWDGWDLDS